jgi:hypothetical protein
MSQTPAFRRVAYPPPRDPRTNNPRTRRGPPASPGRRDRATPPSLAPRECPAGRPWIAARAAVSRPGPGRRADGGRGRLRRPPADHDPPAARDVAADPGTRGPRYPSEDETRRALGRSGVLRTSPARLARFRKTHRAGHVGRSGRRPRPGASPRCSGEPTSAPPWCRRWVRSRSRVADAGPPRPGEARLAGSRPRRSVHAELVATDAVS